MSPLEKQLRNYMGAGLDISEHLGLLRGLAMDNDVLSIVEIGFRDGVSATALASAGKPLVCYDIAPCTKPVLYLRGLAENFQFKNRNSLDAVIPVCDLLHIDSLHTYKHLLAELRLHAPHVSKWIAMHDTFTFCHKGKDGSEPGLGKAIVDFLDENTETWSVHLCLHNNNGMTLLKRR